MILSGISQGTQFILDRSIRSARWAVGLGSAACVGARNRVRDCTLSLGYRTLSPEYFDRVFQFTTGKSIAEHSWTPLHLAAMLGTKEEVEKLIAEGSDLNVRDSEEYTPLFRSIDSANHSACQILLKKGGSSFGQLAYASIGVR